ncbi:hypothetical protein J6590_086472 [Homalodisca vitripennis]|nr:hypothetical protein J6590_086472 [Homalodisca vitripennis]
MPQYRRSAEIDVLPSVVDTPGRCNMCRAVTCWASSFLPVALVASLGIAARNMPGDSTAHSMFQHDLGDGSGIWNKTNWSQSAVLTRAERIIVFDEGPMEHSYIFEILGR